MGQFDHVYGAIGILFLSGVFLLSFWYLRSFTARRKTTISNVPQLSTDEQRALANRIARQQERARRAQEEERRQNARNLAKPVNLYQEKLTRREEERIEKEHSVSQEARRRNAEENQVYAKWKGEIEVQEGGGKGVVSHSVEEFVTFLKENKLVDLDVVANKFNMRIAELIDRITKLEAQGVIYGIVDDRSKYCVVEGEEVAKIDCEIRNSNIRMSLERVHDLVKHCVRTEAEGGRISGSLEYLHSDAG
jgi:hypothetical protein